MAVNKQQSTVVLARSAKLKRIGSAVPVEAAGEYLDKALVRLTGIEPAQAAWKSLFKRGEKVGIKLSCLPGPHLSSSTGVVSAIVARLVSAGIERKDIYVWERTARELVKAGFSLGQGPVNITAADQFSGGGYDADIEFAHSVGTIFSRLMYLVDAHINVPVLKDHDIAGVSIGMKNFYGAIYNPNKFHGNNCDPYAAELCTHPLIAGKLRLVVCDATRIQVNNGPAFYPSYALEYGGLLVGRDPVALDYTGWQIIETHRKEFKLPTLKESGREPRYIFTAARLGLGKVGPDGINLVEI